MAESQYAPTTHRARENAQQADDLDRLRAPRISYLYDEDNEEKPLENDLLGICALIPLGAMSVYGLHLLSNAGFPAWTQASAALSIVGSFGGAFWEALGKSRLQSPARNVVNGLRAANVGLILGTSVYMVSRLTDVRLMGVVTTASAAVATTLFGNAILQGPHSINLAGILGSHVYMAGACLCARPLQSWPTNKGPAYLLAGVLVELAAFLIRPKQMKYRSFVFHGILTLAARLVPLAVMQYDASKLAPAFAHGPIDVFFSAANWLKPSTYAALWHLVGDFISSSFGRYAMLGGLIGAGILYFDLKTRLNLRFAIVGTIWKLLHGLLLASGQDHAYPTPSNYAVRIEMFPYAYMHPNALPLSIPAAAIIPPRTDLGLRQKIRGGMLGAVFGLIHFLDSRFPCADVSVDPRDKPRLMPFESLESQWPTVIAAMYKTKATPDMLKNAQMQGNLISVIVRYSHCSRELRPVDKAVHTDAPDGTHLVLDLAFLEQFQSKPGYFGYGGRAYFDANLEIIGLQPSTSEPVVLRATRHENTVFMTRYKHAEHRIAASTIFLVVVGYHLMEIHTMTSAMAVCISNTFAKLATPHPFHAALHLHYFPSILVQELTTAHLLERGAVFEQVFALTHDEMARYLAFSYANFELYEDLDFDRRDRICRLPQTAWEREYDAVFTKYANQVVQSVWPTEGAYAAEKPLIDEFVEHMHNVFPRRLPARFNGLKHRADMTRFFANCVQFVTVRHEILGTLVPLNFLDHRWGGSSQVPRDYFTPAREEYLSLMLIAGATALKSFPNLIVQGQAELNICLSSVVAREPAVQGIRDAFATLTTDLRNLQLRLSTFENPEFIAMPKDLEIGAGY